MHIISQRGCRKQSLKWLYISLHYSIKTIPLNVRSRKIIFLYTVVYKQHLHNLKGLYLSYFNLPLPYRQNTDKSYRTEMQVSLNMVEDGCCVRVLHWNKSYTLITAIFWTKVVYDISFLSFLRYSNYGRKILVLVLPAFSFYQDFNVPAHRLMQKYIAKTWHKNVQEMREMLSQSELKEGLDLNKLLYSQVHVSTTPIHVPVFWKTHCCPSKSIPVRGRHSNSYRSFFTVKETPQGPLNVT